MVHSRAKLGGVSFSGSGFSALARLLDKKGLRHVESRPRKKIETMHKLYTVNGCVFVYSIYYIYIYVVLLLLFLH